MIPELRDLGEQLHDAARREIQTDRRRRRAPRRTLMTALAGVLVLAVGVAGAALIAVGPPLTDHLGMPQGLKPATTGPTAVTLSVPDPAASERWGVRIYTSRSDLDCIVAGLERNSRIGLVERGVFRPYADDITGACGDLAQGSFYLSLVDAREPAARTLVYGRAAARVKRIEINVNGAPRHTRPGPGGAFLFVLTGRHRLSELQPRAEPADPR